jgi:hypothetical protein
MNSKKVSFSILLATLALPLIASAQTLTGMVNSVEGQIFLVGTWIVIIAWVVAGILFLMATGNPSRLGAAKTAVYIATAGTVLMILSKVAISFVGSLFGL